MEINIDLQDDTVILSLNGNLDASVSRRFKSEINKLLRKNFIHIIIEMSKVTFIDSSGLGACVNIHKTVTGKKGRLIFVELNEAVKKIFRITRVEQTFNIALTKTDALKIIHNGKTK